MLRCAKPPAVAREADEPLSAELLERLDAGTLALTRHRLTNQLMTAELRAAARVYSMRESLPRVRVPAP